jgi:signal transduction histidine kinase
MQYEYSDLPDNAESVVKDVFNGKTTFSEGFSDLLNTATLTVGTPIYDGNEVIGALLLHSPIQGMQEGIKQGSLVLLISMLSALVLSVLLSIYLAFIFTKPLKQLKNTALELANGNYELHTQINRKDEIGDLAPSMDILSQQLNTASQQSAQLQKLRDDFIANISHELRTPVTVIRGSLEALCDAVVTDPHMVQNYHRQMLSESIHLQRLVDDLLDLSRLQKTDFDIAMQPISLCDVLSDSVRSAKQMALAKNIEISLQTDHADCSIIGDYGRLRQMFLIVLNNAVKFSYNNSTIEVGMKANTIIIEDHGTGIDEKDLPYIFERFYKSSIIENADGTGLGLAIAKQIADRHAIKIEVQSQPGKGTKFIFSFNNP